MKSSLVSIEAPKSNISAALSLLLLNMITTLRPSEPVNFFNKPFSTSPLCSSLIGSPLLRLISLLPENPCFAFPNSDLLTSISAQIMFNP